MRKLARQGFGLARRESAQLLPQPIGLVLERAPLDLGGHVEAGGVVAGHAGRIPAGGALVETGAKFSRSFAHPQSAQRSICLCVPARRKTATDPSNRKVAL